MTLSDHHRAHEAAAAWAAECHKPERERQYLSPSEIANALARRPGRLEVDIAERKRILHDRADCIRRGRFDASDVVILSGGNFVPLTPLLPSEILVTGDNTLIRRHGGCPPGPFAFVHLATLSEALFLRCHAVRQYIEKSEHEGAARVMREWFPEEAAAPSDEAATAGGEGTASEPGAEFLADDASSRAEAKPQPKARLGKGGRKPGSGLKDDEAQLMQMLRLLVSGDARTPWDAAGRVMSEEEGVAPDSVRRRLHRHFRDRFGGIEPPPGKTWKDVQEESFEDELKAN